MTYLYLDVDGVLADFLGGCERLFKRRVPRTEKSNWHFYRDWGLTDTSFWNRIHKAGQKFWENLEVLESGRILVKTLERVYRRHFDIVLATAVAPFPEALAGRMAWLRKHFPQYAGRTIFIASELKHRLAAPGRVLIDDNEDTCRQWELLGGKAIVWPAITNNNWIFIGKDGDDIPIGRLLLDLVHER